jgi:flagellar biosynthesis protein
LDDTNRPRPRKLATALAYDLEHRAAPEVVATGKGLIAEHILEIARQHDVPIREDALLAEALAVLGIGEMIPPELYQAIAEILAFVYRLDASRRS